MSAEVVEPEILTDAESTALARPEDVAIPEEFQRAVQAVQDKMALEWKKEAEERKRWKREDFQLNARQRLAAMLAGSILAEGAVGSRPRAQQVAEMAIEYADAVLAELRRTDKTTDGICPACGRRPSNGG